VGIITLGLVVFIVEGTPFSLEVEHVEVGVFVHFVDDPGLDVVGGVGEGAVFSVIALVEGVGVAGAELGLVLLNVVEPLHSIMSQGTFIFESTLV